MSANDDEIAWWAELRTIVDSLAPLTTSRVASRVSKQSSTSVKYTTNEQPLPANIVSAFHRRRGTALKLLNLSNTIDAFAIDMATRDAARLSPAERRSVLSQIRGFPTMLDLLRMNLALLEKDGNKHDAVSAASSSTSSSSQRATATTRKRKMAGLTAPF